MGNTLVLGNLNTPSTRRPMRSVFWYKLLPNFLRLFSLYMVSNNLDHMSYTLSCYISIHPSYWSVLSFFWRSCQVESSPQNKEMYIHRWLNRAAFILALAGFLKVYVRWRRFLTIIHKMKVPVHSSKGFTGSLGPMMKNFHRLYDFRLGVLEELGDTSVWTPAIWSPNLVISTRYSVDSSFRSISVCVCYICRCCQSSILSHPRSKETNTGLWELLLT